jgi:hypothetical protein
MSCGSQSPEASTKGLGQAKAARPPKAQDAKPTRTMPPRVDLRRLNLGDLCVLMCGLLFRPVIGDFAEIGKAIV